MATLRVAAIQVTSLDGEPRRNLANAERFVAEAARDGARLVLCPEFLAAGYVYEESIWDAGEPASGATEAWLARSAREHDVLVGATYLEAEGDDFWNTFALYGPTGLLGRVRKSSLPVGEGWYFRPCPDPKIIETPLGRIGVGICMDNQTRGFLDHVAQMQPDLILMPHSAPSPQLPVAGRFFDDALDATPLRYARALGVPVVLSNKVSSPTPTVLRMPFLTAMRVPIRFRGRSRIVDGDGTSRAHLVDTEGALVADVSLDASRKRVPVVPRRGYWSFAPGALATPLGAILRRLDRLGRRAYRASARRAEKARAAASRTTAS